VAEALSRQGRFQEVTFEALLQKGATHFAWLRPKDRMRFPVPTLM
jgi:hypothetical protein